MNRLVVDRERHFREFVAGLIGHRLATQEVFAIARNFVFGDDMSNRVDRVPVTLILGRAPWFELLAGEANLARLRGIGGADDLLADLLGGIEIFFHEQRRDRQHVADVVEAVADIVRRKIVRRLEVDAEQIAHGVVVLRAIQSPDGDSAGIAFEFAVDVVELVLQPRRDRQEIVMRRPLAALFDGGHGFDLQHREDLLPNLARILHRLLAVEVVQRDASFGGVGPVTLQAMLLEKRSDLRLERVWLGSFDALRFDRSRAPHDDTDEHDNSDTGRTPQRPQPLRDRLCTRLDSCRSCRKRRLRLNGRSLQNGGVVACDRAFKGGLGRHGVRGLASLDRATSLFARVLGIDFERRTALSTGDRDQLFDGLAGHQAHTQAGGWADRESLLGDLRPGQRLPGQSRLGLTVSSDNH